MNPQTRIEQLLKEDGAQLVRHKKHAIWKLSNGKTFVLPSTPSDGRALRNAVKGLENLLELRINTEHKPETVPDRLPSKKRHTPPNEVRIRVSKIWTSETPALRTLRSELSRLSVLQLRPGVGLEIR